MPEMVMAQAYTGATVAGYSLTTRSVRGKYTANPGRLAKHPLILLIELMIS